MFNVVIFISPIVKTLSVNKTGTLIDKTKMESATVVSCCLFCASNLPPSGLVKLETSDVFITPDDDYPPCVPARVYSTSFLPWKKETSAIQTQLEAFFILREVLKMSKEALSQFLGESHGQDGHPDLWGQVQVCFQCEQLVFQYYQAFRRKPRVEWELERIGKELKSKIDESKDFRGSNSVWGRLRSQLLAGNYGSQDVKVEDTQTAAYKSDEEELNMEGTDIKIEIIDSLPITENVILERNTVAGPNQKASIDLSFKYRCPHCPYKNNKTRDYEAHLELHNGKKSSAVCCPVCGIYTSAISYQYHRYQYHGGTGRVRRKNRTATKTKAVAVVPIQVVAPLTNLTRTGTTKRGYGKGKNEVPASAASFEVTSANNCGATSPPNEDNLEQNWTTRENHETVVKVEKVPHQLPFQVISISEAGREVQEAAWRQEDDGADTDQINGTSYDFATDCGSDRPEKLDIEEPKLKRVLKKPMLKTPMLKKPMLRNRKWKESDPNYIRHRVNHSKIMLYECRHCPFTVKSRLSCIEEHVELHQPGSRALPCKECKVFVLPEKLSAHQKYGHQQLQTNFDLQY